MHTHSVKAAVLDYGVSHNMPGIDSGVTIREEGTQFTHEPGHYHDEPWGHGNLVARIIKDQAPGLPLVVVKLAPEQGGIRQSLLAEGICWCLQDPAIRIINISLGFRTIHPHPGLFEACRQAHAQGVVVLAAVNRWVGEGCVPGFLPHVFGVAAGLSPHGQDFAYLGPGPVNLLAAGGLQPVATGIPSTVDFLEGSSYATAHMAARLGKALQHHPEWGLGQVTDYLKANSAPTMPLWHPQEQSMLEGIDMAAPEGPHPAEYLTHETLKKFKQPLVVYGDKRAGYWLKRYGGLWPEGKATYIALPQHIIEDNRKKYVRPKDFERLAAELHSINWQQHDGLVIATQQQQQPLKASKLLLRALMSEALRHHIPVATYDTYLAGQLPAHSVNKLGFKAEQLTTIMAHQGWPKPDAKVVAVMGVEGWASTLGSGLYLRHACKQLNIASGHISADPLAQLFGAEFVYDYAPGQESPALPPVQLLPFAQALLKGLVHATGAQLVLAETFGTTVTLQAGTQQSVLAAQTVQWLHALQPDAVLVFAQHNHTADEVNRVCRNLAEEHGMNLAGILVPPPKDATANAWYTAAQLNGTPVWPATLPEMPEGLLAYLEAMVPHPQAAPLAHT